MGGITVAAKRCLIGAPGIFIRQEMNLVWEHIASCGACADRSRFAKRKQFVSNYCTEPSGLTPAAPLLIYWARRTLSHPPGPAFTTVFSPPPHFSVEKLKNNNRFPNRRRKEKKKEKVDSFGQYR
jgi:hypothetical protein